MPDTTALPLDHESSQLRPMKKKPREIAVINQHGCTGCEVCIEFCPVDCIYVVPGDEQLERKKLVEVDLDICIGCKLCSKYCPWETIDMIAYEQAYQKAPLIDYTIRTVFDEKLWMKESPAERVPYRIEPEYSAR
jgi:NAD-dependent dihydropyrimidine dehydrogenase PreA subunit